MRSIIIAAGLALALAGPVNAQQFQPPGHLQPPGPHPKRWLPTPHPGKLMPHYDLACTVGVNPILGGHLWHVTNVGRTTAPAGLAVETVFGSFHADFHLPHAMAPGDGADFASPSTPFDHPFTDHDVCDVAYDH